MSAAEMWFPPEEIGPEESFLSDARKRVRAAVYLLVACDTKPSRDKVAAIIRAAGGKTIRSTMLMSLIREVLSENGPTRADQGRPMHEAGPEFPSSGNENGRNGPTAADPGRQDNRYIESTPSVRTLTGTHTAYPVERPKRVRIEPMRLDDDFGPAEPQVQSVLANDSAERRDGKISESVVSALRQRLARARERHGPEAFSHGLEIAIQRGKGAAYAAGCMKRYDPSGGGSSGAQPSWLSDAPNTSDLLPNTWELPPLDPDDDP